MLDAALEPDVPDLTMAHRGGRATPAFALAGAACWLDASGVLMIEDARVLVVADLHLEKGSAMAARRIYLPPYDTAATLARLAEAIQRLKPRLVVALGDSFHDARGGERMGARDVDALRALQRGRDWLWIAGNHDPAPTPRLGGEACGEWRHAGLVLRHEPQPGAQSGEIAGHLHPVARIAGRGASLRRRCFVSDGGRCVLPAFGAYAGGLNLRDAAFAGLFQGAVTAHVLGRSQVFAIKANRCAPDAPGLSLLPLREKVARSAG